MAGIQPPIKSANSAQPSAVKSPVPGDELSAEEQSYLASVEAPQLSPEETQFLDSAPTSVGAEPSGSETVFESPWYTSVLPTVGGIVGGIAGSAGGPLGAIGGAVAGGTAGQGYREYIETNFLGKPPTDPNQALKDAGQAGLIEGAGQVAGMGIAKGASKLAGAASKYISAPVRQFMDDTLKSVRDSVEAPLMKFIAERGTPLNTEAAGNEAKILLKKSITNKYGPFVQAYTDLDGVAKATPLADEARRKFTMGLKEWAAENHAGDNWRVIKKFADDIDAANTGRHLDDVIGQINDARDVAFRSGATKQAAVLKEVRDRVTDFSEGEITKLASRVQAGKATPQEVQMIAQIAQQRGAADPNPMKYAKSLASDYLKNKDKIKGEYAAFRGFLEDVGEQTKLKVAGKGPMAFLNNIDDVPSEKLIERMFDPKNAAALRRMQKETPDVFDMVTRSKLTQMVQKASPTGSLDLPRFQKEVFKLPDSTRKLLFTPENLSTINKVATDPRLKKLEALNRMGEGMVVKWAKDVANVAGVLGSAVKPSPGVRAGVRQVTGQSAMGLGNVLAPRSEE